MQKSTKHSIDAKVLALFMWNLLSWCLTVPVSLTDLLSNFAFIPATIGSLVTEDICFFVAPLVVSCCFESHIKK